MTDDHVHGLQYTTCTRLAALVKAIHESRSKTKAHDGKRKPSTTRRMLDRSFHRWTSSEVFVFADRVLSSLTSDLARLQHPEAPKWIKFAISLMKQIHPVFYEVVARPSAATNVKNHSRDLIKNGVSLLHVRDILSALL